MKNQEIAFQLHQITQNGNIHLPESIDFELSDEEMERIGTLADGKSLFGWDED